MKIKIGLIQFQPALGDNRHNLERVEHLLGNCSDTDIVVIPELSNSGYNFVSFEQAESSSEVLSGSPFIDMLVRQSSVNKCTIVAGINEREGDKLYNTSVLLDSKGILGKYRKIHLFVDEKDFFAPGNLGLPVFQVDGYKIGMQICFDYLFADSWRILALKGADLICHPSNLITENAYRTLPGQALMNRVFIATANRTGTERGLTFCGKSVVHDPSGEVRLILDREEEAVAKITVDLALARDKMITSRNHIFDDRRPEAYF